MLHFVTKKDKISTAYSKTVCHVHLFTSKCLLYQQIAGKVYSTALKSTPSTKKMIVFTVPSDHQTILRLLLPPHLGCSPAVLTHPQMVQGHDLD